MINTNKILTEWTYRLDSGYPKTDSDYEVLRDVLTELTDFNPPTVNNIVNRSKGLTEQDDLILDLQTPEQFSEFIYSEYAMEGQKFIGLELFFEKIQIHPNKTQIMNVITDNRSTNLKSGTYEISGVDEYIYDLIMATIKVPNGHPSELWFAIKFNGEVKGGVAGDSIVSDIDVGNDGVSLKDYASLSTVDFGNLTKDTALLLKSAVNTFEMLTGATINKSMTRDSINAVLDNLDSDELRDDIRKLIAVSQDSEIKVIRRFVDKLQQFMPDGNPERIVDNFCDQLNETISAKLLEVNWWGIISKKTLHLETSQEMMQALKSTNNRISPAVSNFKGFHLFVNGNRINAIIKNIRAKQEAEG